MYNVWFYLIIALFILDFFWEQFLEYLNRTRMNPLMPKELDGIYDSEKYAKQQAYQKENSRFNTVSDGFMFIIGLTFLWHGGIGWLDELLRRYIDVDILLSVSFFWSISFATWIISIPFDWYNTFVIEQKFGFNTTTPRTFVTDKVKELSLTLILISIVISILAAAYKYIGNYSWLWAWFAVVTFSLIILFFYSEWIVPIFNKQTPLEEGELREAIEAYAQKADFPIQNIYVIDGSKRSTKSNAYFTGFGGKKRIVLYDTLKNDLNTEEIVAILAHEIGHYKKKHIIYRIAISFMSIGFWLWLLTLFLDNPQIAYALGGRVASLHLSIIGFSLLYSPLSELLNFATNCLSRRDEYAADNFAATYGTGEALITALKKISSKALSNLTPHPFVVFWTHSHPTLLQRMRNIESNKSHSNKDY